MGKKIQAIKRPREQNFPARHKGIGNDAKGSMQVSSWEGKEKRLCHVLTTEIVFRIPQRREGHKTKRKGEKTSMQPGLKGGVGPRREREGGKEG